MRLVVCGTAAFAVPTLRAVATEHDVLAVVTQPDRPGARGRPAPRPVANAAAALGLPVLRPVRLRAPESMTEVLALRPDAVVVAAYGQILPAALLDALPGGGVNVHASLLPRWRGAAPVAAAILAGDEVTGVSIMRMDAGLDTGPVYARRAVHVEPDATTPRLTEALAELGAQLLLTVLHDLQRGEAAAVAQDHDAATVAPRLTRAAGELDWLSCTAVEVDRHVRALQPWPGTTVLLAGQRVRVLSGGVVGAEAGRRTPGSIHGVQSESVVVMAASGAYRLDAVQPPGGRPMTAAAFLRGRRWTGEP